MNIVYFQLLTSLPMQVIFSNLPSFLSTWRPHPSPLSLVNLSANPNIDHVNLPSPLYDQYCKDHYADGHCDQGCNNAECEWDGLDCANNMPEKLADGHLVLVVHIPPEQLKNGLSTFLRELSSVLHTNVVFRRDANGEPMVFPYYGSEQELAKHNVKRSTDSWPDWAVVPANMLGQMKESVGSMVNLPRQRRELDLMQVKG